MGAFVAGTSSIATSVQTLNQTSSSLPALAPSSKVSFVRRRAGSFTCKSSTESGGGGTTDVRVEDEASASAPAPAPPASPSPFSAGKISSRVKVKRPLEKTELETETEVTSPFSVSSLPKSPSQVSSPFSPSRNPTDVTSPFSTANLPFEKRVPTPAKEEVKPTSSGSTSSTGKTSSRVKVRTGTGSGDGSASKAFKAPPTIASPFDSSPVPRDPTMNKRGITMIPEMDERVLESRKQILKELYSVRKSDSRMNAAPADIFGEPKPLAPGEDTIKFDLIKGAEPYLLLISFSLITAIMFGTAFLAYKLGAFHYNEL